MARALRRRLAPSPSAATASRRSAMCQRQRRARDRRARATPSRPASSTCTRTTTPPSSATRAMDFKIMQGVTTDVVGNCGAGVAPVNDAFRSYFATRLRPHPRRLRPALDRRRREYFEAVDAAHPACNVAAYVPHGVVRYNVWASTAASRTDAELAQMRDLLDEAMRAGAIGMSTGLIYPPGRSRARPSSSSWRRSPRSTAASTPATSATRAGLLEAVDEAITHRRAVRLPRADLAPQGRHRRRASA